MPITPIFAAIFALIYVGLSLNVIRHRFSKKVSLGDGKDKDLRVAIRTHGNFSEYLPFALILFWFLEEFTYSSYLVLVLGSILLVARIAHVIGMRDPANYLIFRQVGTIATHLVIVFSAVRLLWHYFPV